MCGRYYFDEDTIEDILRMTGQSLDESVIPGDIAPSMDSIVLYGGERERLRAEKVKWGLQSYEGRHLIINARSETVLEKKTFKDSILNRRCIVPAKWFYEWDEDKNKAVFTLPGSSSVYMAGFYDIRDSMKRYVILTTAANESVIKIHDRMPLIINEKEISAWIFDSRKTEEFLRKESPMLDKKQDYEQLSLFG